MEWDMYEELLYSLPGVGRKTMEKIAEKGKASELFLQMNEDNKKSYLRGRGVGEKVSERICQELRTINPEERYKRLKSSGICFQSVSSKGYPISLLNIPDRPYGIYTLSEGERNLNREEVCLAVVGARICSEYGRYMAGVIGELCAALNICVISGMACGIDGIVQRTAIEHGGTSIAVLGSGVDVCYPRENRKLYDSLIQKGMIVSEYPPGMEARAQNFPPRNRIISGMADALLVVEAKRKSGTFITVNMALEQGRDVYVVPGRLTDPLSAGCNELVRQGAEIVCSLEETLKEIKGAVITKRKIKLDGTDNLALQKVRVRDNPYPAKSLESRLFQELEVVPSSAEMLCEKNAQYSTSNILLTLLKMETDGTVLQKDGQYFICFG